MEPVTWLIVIFFINLIIVAILPPAKTVRPQSPDTLTYCRTCGCRHRQQWMIWDDVDYRCTVCCTHL